MIVYTTTDFSGHWPVGTSAIVVANDRGHALRLLKESLATEGLLKKNSDLTMEMFQEVDVTKASCDILQNGDY